MPPVRDTLRIVKDVGKGKQPVDAAGIAIMSARTVGVLDSGYPVLPACSPPRGSIDGVVRPGFNINTARPLRAAKPREADDAQTPEGSGLLRRAPEGRRVLCSYLMRLADMSHDDQG